MGDFNSSKVAGSSIYDCKYYMSNFVCRNTVFCNEKIKAKNVHLTGLHRLQFSIHKILCMQNHFRCTSMHLGNRAHKRGYMHVTNNIMICQKKLY